MLVSEGEEDGGGLWAANVVLSFMMSGRESNESQEYPILQFIELTRSLDMANETLKCDCLR